MATFFGHQKSSPPHLLLRLFWQGVAAEAPVQSFNSAATASGAAGGSDCPKAEAKSLNSGSIKIHILRWGYHWIHLDLGEASPP